MRKVSIFVFSTVMASVFCLTSSASFAAQPSIVSATMNTSSLVANNATQYTVTLTVEDTDGVNDIRDMRIMLHNGGVFSSENGRGYICWGQTDADITHYDSTWATPSNAIGGGRWSYNTGGWGQATYITPASVVTYTSGNRRIVIFNFSVKSVWANTTNQKLRSFSRDAANSASGWIESSLNYEISAASGSYVPRRYFGARYEPESTVIHGAGQCTTCAAPLNMGWDYYADTLGPDRTPIIIMEYAGVTSGQSRYDQIRQKCESIQAGRNKFVIPQIGFDIPTGQNVPTQAQIQQTVNGLKSLNRPFYLRIGYEFNGTWYSPMFDPPYYVQSFRLVVDALRANGVPVITVWCAFPGYNDYYGNWGFLKDYYPGDDYVDWWSIDVFPASSLTHPNTIVFTNKAEEHGKPVMIGESTPMGLGADDLSDWNDWFVPFFNLIKNYPSIKGHTYINWNWSQTAQWPTWGDARLETGNATVRANYIAELSSPLYVHAGVHPPDFAAKPYIRLEAENYTRAYDWFPELLQNPPRNDGGEYRDDKTTNIYYPDHTLVDMTWCQDEASAPYNGVKVIKTAEWEYLEFDPVHFDMSANYYVRARYANGHSYDCRLRIYIDGVHAAYVMLPPTGSFNNWATAKSDWFSITEGTKSVRVMFYNGVSPPYESADLNWIEFVRAGVTESWSTNNLISNFELVAHQNNNTCHTDTGHFTSWQMGVWPLLSGAQFGTFADGNALHPSVSCLVGSGEQRNMTQIASLKSGSPTIPVVGGTPYKLTFTCQSASAGPAAQFRRAYGLVRMRMKQGNNYIGDVWIGPASGKIAGQWITFEGSGRFPAGCDGVEISAMATGHSDGVGNSATLKIDSVNLYSHQKPGAPTGVTAAPSVICAGSSTTLIASPGSGGSAVYWYAGSCGGTLVGTGTSVVVTPGVTTTYYARTFSSDTWLYSDACVPVTVTVNGNAKPAKSAVAAPSTICSGGSANLSVQLPGLLDYSIWTVGTGSVGGYSINGSASENHRITGTDPWGRTTVVWEARPDDVSGPDGGWNFNNIPIDNTKLYRFSVWVNRTVMGADGRFYLGTRGYGATEGVIRLTDGTTQTNPYFWNSSAPPGSGLPAGEWVLVVGHVFPHNHSGTANHPDSGRYTTNGGRIGAISNDYKWRPETTATSHRTYLYYTTDTSVRQRWVYPRLDVVDGTEPSISDLLNGYDPDGLGAGVNWKWYSGSCGGSAVGTGKNVNVSPQSTTTYFVRTEGLCNSSVCRSVTVTVNNPPTISVHPKPRKACEGADVTFSVTAASPLTISYQWRKNGQNISGKTDSTLTLTSVSASDQASYDCVVSNSCGSVPSQSASLTVVGCISIPEAKLLPDGSTVGLLGKAVTSAGSDVFSIQELDRSAGIRVVKDNHGLIVGDSAEVHGTIVTDDGVERYIEADFTARSGSASVIPLFLSLKYLGGGDFYFNPVTGAGQRGVFQGIGLNNIGLKVRVFGRITAVTPSGIYIDDGSNLTDPPYSGVLVICDPFGLATGNYVEVTGISSGHKVADGSFIRQILTYSPTDIRKITGL